MCTPSYVIQASEAGIALYNLFDGESSHLDTFCGVTALSQ